MKRLDKVTKLVYIRTHVKAKGDISTKIDKNSLFLYINGSIALISFRD